MIQFPKSLEDFLLSYIKREFYQGTKRAHFIDRPFGASDLHFFTKGVARLSELFTSERAELESGYLNQPSLHAAYLLYFLPINFAKAAYVFKGIPQSFWQKKNYRILDLGCGPGSATLAFLTKLQEMQSSAEIELTLVDQNKNILKDAQTLINSLGKSPRIKIQTVPREARHFRWVGNYDLILMSHMLNEWVQYSAIDRAAWLLPNLQNHLTPSGILAILEPALKRPTRELMALRDHLVESKERVVLSPCLHEEICPMLAATKHDWCHFYLDWEEPVYMKELDRLVKNDNRFLKVAYLLLGNRHAYEKILPREQRNLFKVVSNRMATRGKTELVLCGLPGRIKLSRLDRDRSPTNAEMDTTRRGDLVELPDYHAKGYDVDRILRLNRKSVFKSC